MAKNGTPDFAMPLVLLGLGAMVISKAFGESKDDKKADITNEALENLPPSRNPFNVSLYKANKKTGFSRWVHSGTEIKAATVRIHKAIGIFTDDESAIMSGFKIARTRFEIYLIAYFWEHFYKTDLYNVLISNLSEKELARINGYVLNLPTYLKTPGQTV